MRAVAAFADGVEAYERGCGVAACAVSPWRVAEFDAWLSGWLAARACDSRMARQLAPMGAGRPMGRVW